MFQANLATAPGVNISPESIAPSTLPASPLTASDEFDAVIGMTLADAIREGAEFMPQARGWGDGINKGCALTVAGLALEKKGYK